MIRLQVSYDDQFAIIKIYNTGNPIKENQLSKIFEPYFTKREKDGTGLGLDICRQIIEDKYQGSIHAENRIDSVEFTIKLPLTEN